MNRPLRSTLAVASILAVVSAAGVASAHALLTAPKPRNTSDSEKTGPCGGKARTKVFTGFKPGQTVKVNWNETIDHSGCFQIAFSKTGDSNWVTLTQTPDGQDNGVSKATPRAVTTMVTIPNEPCESCTLQLRQLMQGQTGQTCAADAAPEKATNGTYYSCADIAVGDGYDGGMFTVGTGAPVLDAGPSTGDDDDTSGDDTSAPGDDTSGGGAVDGGGTGVGAAPTAGNGSGSTDLNAGKGGDGCSFAPGGTSGVALVFGVMGFGLAFARRRRAKS